MNHRYTLVAAAVLATATARGQTAQRTQTLRVGTFNVAGIDVPSEDTILPEQCGFGAFATIDWTCTGDVLAERILTSDYDVIALNEAWNVQLRNRIIYNVSAQYPYYAQADADSSSGAVTVEGSGILLLSKYPFYTDTAAFVGAGRPWDCAPLGYTQTQADSHHTQNRGLATAFWPYTYATDFDEFATKGVLYAGVYAPGGRLFHIFSTHTQSDPTASSLLPFPVPVGAPTDIDRALAVSIRQSQADEATAFINCVLDKYSAPRDQATTIVMGDFNIEGAPQYDLTHDTIALGSEYQNLLTSAGAHKLGGTATPLEDTWWHTNVPASWTGASGFWNSTFDPGLTWDRYADPHPYASDPSITPPRPDLTRHRYDYMMMRPATTPGRDVVNHETIGYNLYTVQGAPREAGLTRLVRAANGTVQSKFAGTQNPSDHRGLNVELVPTVSYPNNLEGANPQHAYQDPAWTDSSTYLGSDSRSSLPCGGCAFWYKITVPGSYAFNVDPKFLDTPGTTNNLIARVYSGDNFSQPLQWNTGDTLHDGRFVGLEYNMPRPPYYVKVMEDTTAAPFEGTTPYVFTWTRANCATEAEACALTAATPLSTPLASEFRIFKFRVDTGRLSGYDSNLPQHAHVVVSAPTTTPPLLEDVILHDSAGIQIAVLYAPNGTDGTNSTWTLDLPATFFNPTSPPSREVFLVADRHLGADPDKEITATYYTDLTYLFGAPRLFCKDEQETPADEIYVSLSADDVGFVADTNCSSNRWLVSNDFDSGESKDISPYVFAQNSYRRVLGHATLTICEDDQDYDEFTQFKWNMPAIDQVSDPAGGIVEPLDLSNNQWAETDLCAQGLMDPCYGAGSVDYFLWNHFAMSHAPPAGGTPCAVDGDCSVGGAGPNGQALGVTSTCDRGLCCFKQPGATECSR